METTTTMFCDLPLSCRCGHTRGVAREVSPPAGFRLVSYCKDCQAFAYYLQRPDVLDPSGGTDIFQMPPGRLTFSAGEDALRSLRLSERTKVLRWYTECCRTPIANTAGGARFPVIGLIRSFMGHDLTKDLTKDLAASGYSRDGILGPPRCRIHERSATAPLPPNAPPPASFGFLAHRAGSALGWWTRGLPRPNPFFDERTKAPRAEPRVLTPSERAAL
jgi:hypothetical protein